MNVDKINPVGLLYSLLVCYSPSGNEEHAAASLAAFMRQSGFDTRVDQVGNVIGSIGEGPRDVVLLGHIDTVAGFIQPYFEGDRLFGRGAVDAKGPLACFTSAAAMISPRPGWKITVIGVVGEESDSRGAKYLCNTYAAPELVIIGEPSGWESVTLGYKGGIWGQYQIQRAIAHTAGNTENACEVAVSFWNRIVKMVESYNQGFDRIFDQISPTLVGMHSHENGYTQQANLKFNVRIPPEISPQEMKNMLEGLLEDGQIHFSEGLPAYKSGKNELITRQLIASIRKNGGKPGYKLKTGTSDMNVVGPVWNCPIVAYGPGDSMLDHTPEEHILIEEYKNSIAVLIDSLNEFTANEDSVILDRSISS